MEKSTNADSHVFKPKMRATAERCPVKIFQQLIDRHQKCARMIHRSTSPSTTSTILDRTGTRNNHLASTQNRCHKKQAFFREETVLRTQQWWNFLATRAFRVWTTTTDHLLSSRSTSHLLSNYQTSSLMQPPLSVSIQSPPLSVQSLCPVVAPVQPHSVNSGTLPSPVVSQIQPNLPAILSAVQSHSPVLGQVQTPASFPSPLQQLIIKEQMNFALKLKTKHPQVIYSDSEDFYTTIWIVILYLAVC